MSNSQAMACELHARNILRLRGVESGLGSYRPYAAQPDAVRHAMTIAAETARAYGCVPGGFSPYGELSVLAEAWRPDGNGGADLVASAEVWRSHATPDHNNAALVAFLATVAPLP